MSHDRGCPKCFEDARGCTDQACWYGSQAMRRARTKAEKRSEIARQLLKLLREYEALA
jgi:hypothetical protein